jgi:hypothetical protein
MDTVTTKQKRRRNFYAKHETIVLVEALAEQERERLGEPQYGAGKIVDAAVREYAMKRYSPEEIAQLVAGEGVV